MSIFISLVFYPKVGLIGLWNVLIPAAPALLVIEGGLWRNVCPLAIVNLLPRHLNLSKKKIMPAALQAKLQLAAIIALFIIVPLRHLIFNTNGGATAILLFTATAVSVSMGFVYDWKSGWCNSLCPVHPVEKLYGGNTLFSMPNAHCDQCINCSVPCPDSTPNLHPSSSKKTTYNHISGVLTIGGLPGFIWGYFQVPDQSGSITYQNLFSAFEMPVSGLCITLCLYLCLKKLVNKKSERVLINCFAAAGVSCYYWFRIPALLGFSKFSNDVVLLNLKNAIPYGSILAITVLTTVFFFWWLVLRKPNHKSWVIRPEFAKGAKHNKTSAAIPQTGV
ncbi:hypothetical protein [Mucilaginibacter gotjawali]|uniref:4Fe-4S ferredoxin-type domain-containing protein n=1 Tax=Mucilaginibacter gotjawali TaxID=1550579 RepID=A0A839S8T9_9SPHI|nr:hypothetical protein [Mucilaginibacter gotjawali]MBB3054395.1 hypothetical protein [Mucilaginibacter gotjawali]